MERKDSYTSTTIHINPHTNGSVSRLTDQLYQYKVAQQHMQDRHLHELEFYPAHDPRTETPEYKKVHHRMAVELDLPCMVCGVRHSTLGDPQENRFGSKQMETHHHIVEWALANAIDVDKFNRSLRPSLAHRHPHHPVWHYEEEFDQDKVHRWVDHSEHNLWVICDVHHRAKYLGIHEITFPIWAPMDLLRSDFEKWALDEIRRIRAQK